MNTKKTIMSIIITIIAVAIIFGIFVYIRDVKICIMLILLKAV